MTFKLKANAPSVDKLVELLIPRIREKFGTRIDNFMSGTAEDKREEDAENVREEVCGYVGNVLKSKKLSEQQKQSVILGVNDEFFGFGPLGQLMRRPDVGNIYIEGAKRVYVEICGRTGERIEKTQLPFRDDLHVLETINKAIASMGCKLSSDTPAVNGRFPNGTLFYASMPPIAVHGPSMSIVCPSYETTSLLPGWEFTHDKTLHKSLISSEVRGERKNSVKQVVTLTLSHEESSECLSVPCYSHASMFQRFSARAFRGKTVIFKGSLKSNEVNSSYFYIRAKGRGNNWLEAARTDNDKFCQNGQWQNFECMLRVPDRAVTVTIGLSASGPGVVSVSDLSFGVQSSGSKPTRKPNVPINLELLSELA